MADPKQVADGRSLFQAAVEAGFRDHLASWNDGANSAIKKSRVNPHTLAEADQVVLPALEPKQVAGKSTDQFHTFTVRAAGLLLNLAIQEAVGGAAPCQTSPPPPQDPPANAGASVLVVDERKTGWIGLELVDTLKAPVAGAEFEVTLPDGHKVGGRLDATGRVRVEGVDPGQCEVRFTHIDRRDFA